MEKREEKLKTKTINVGIGRKNGHQNSDRDDSEPRECRENLNQNRTCRTTIRNRLTRRSRAIRCNQETKDISELSDNDNCNPRPTTHFLFGMT